MKNYNPQTRKLIFNNLRIFLTDLEKFQKIDKITITPKKPNVPINAVIILLWKLPNTDYNLRRSCAKNT